MKNEVLVTGDGSGLSWNLCVWDYTNGSALTAFKGGVSRRKTVCLLGNSFLISAQENKSVLNVWKLHRHEQQPLKITTPGKANVLSASPPDGKFLVGGIEESLYLWQTSTGKLLKILTKHYQPITAIQWSDDGSFLVSGGEDGTVMVWNLCDVLEGNIRRLPGAKEILPDHEPQPLHVWNHSSLEITDLVIGRGGGGHCRVFTVSRDQSCRIYDLSSGNLILEVTFSTPLSSITVDTSETRIFLGSFHGEIHVFALKSILETSKTMITKDTKNTMMGHRGEITCLSVSVDGSTLASGASEDAEVKLWHVESKQCVRRLSHKEPVTYVRFLAPPLPGLLNPNDYQQDLTFPQLAKTLDVSTNYNQEFFTTVDAFSSDENDDEDDDNDDNYKRMKSSLSSSSSEDVERLKRINLKLYQSAIKELLQ